MDDLEILSKEINSQLEKIGDETLEIIYKNHAKAVEYVKKGAEAVNYRKLEQTEIEELAHEMQVVAKMVLKERSTN